MTVSQHRLGSLEANSEAELWKQVVLLGAILVKSREVTQDWAEREAEALYRSKTFIRPGMELRETRTPSGEDFISLPHSVTRCRLPQEEGGFWQSSSLEKAQS